ncbi:DUF2278 family protein, partial [Burkholderia anthina]|uniref:DUF2278 family protein n=1 Tax=Burkholderia anthina TaxID=179879 RepID=UPI001FC7CD72
MRVAHRLLATATPASRNCQSQAAESNPHSRQDLPMALNYGLLKGTVSGHLRDADDDHYQILVHAGDEVFRIAVNVKSSAPHAPSTVLFESRDTLPDSLSSQLMAAEVGFTKLASKP